MKRILIASYHFPPSTAVGARRVARLARLLPSFGYEVDVICAAPDSSLASNTTALDEVATHGGIHRVPTPYVFGRNPDQLPPAEPSWHTAWWKARAYLEWAVLTGGYDWRWGEAAVRDIDRSRDYDIMIVDTPPRAAGVPLMRFAARRGIPVVLDLRDVWVPDRRSSKMRWHPNPEERRRRWRSRLADEAIGTASRVVVSSADMLEVVRHYFPDRAARDFACVPNAYETVDEEMEEPSRSPGQPLRIVYTGSLAYGRDEQVADLMRAMGTLRRSRGRSLVQLIVAGSGGETLLRTARSEGVADDVEVRGWIAEEAAVELQRGADALLLLQPSVITGTRVAIPAKLFEYMSRRRNILGMLGPGPSARIIDEHHLGIVVGTKDPDGIARALEDLEARVRRSPILPRPPEAYSEEQTVAAFADVLEGLSGG